MISGREAPKPALEKELQRASQTGRIYLGEQHLFIRKMFAVYYISYEEIQRCFRRVMFMPSGFGKNRREVALENLVIWDREGECAQAQIPGTEAARSLIDALRRKAPHAEFSSPK